MSDKKEPGLKFHLFDVTKIIFERGSSEKEYSFDIQIQHAINIDVKNPSIFNIHFHIIVTSEDENKSLNLQIEAIAHFELIGELPSDVIDNYKNISAPSIAYPYIRAFLSNLTLQSGINPINLPPINFAE